MSRPPPRPSMPQTARQPRANLAQALRENLRRRKAQAEARAADKAEPGDDEPLPPTRDNL